MKRTLALVLALVLVVGMMAVPVSADFTDSKAIKYTEAVEVMSAIGVINGFEDGSFDPNGNLTREQAAKVMAYLLLGAKNADALKATSAPFADVAADRWSAGYIAYAVNEGIINGRDENTFDPTGNVTGYEFAKLLLGALGYSVKIEQFTGATWSINVAKIALDIELFEGNDGADYNKALTREEAALYAFNLLSRDLVEYENKGTEIDLGNGIIISTGASSAEAVYGTKDTIIANDEIAQFAEKYFPKLVLFVSSDDFGRPANVWKNDKKEVGTYAKEAELTYTVGTKGKDIYADLGKPKAADTDYEFFVDGKPISDITGVYSGFSINTGIDKRIGGNGTLVEVFEKTGTNDYIVTVINTYAGEIASWTEADDDKDVKESVAVTAIGTIDLDGEEFETTSFAEADADDETVVYFTAAWNGEDYTLQTVVEADLVSAFISSTTGTTSFVAGGTTYKYNATIDATATYNKDNDDADIYLDSYGYAIYVDMEAAAADEYAYLEKTRVDTNGWDTEYLAKLVLANGEVVTVTVDKYNNADPDEDEFDDVANVIVKYTVNKNGEYKLTSVADEVVTGAPEIEKGVANIGGGYYANSKTIFILAKYKDGKVDSYSVYTGIKNVPDVKAGADRIVYEKSGATKVVVILDAKTSNTGASSNIFVTVKAKANVISGADYDDYFEAAAVVDGEIVTLKIATGTAAHALFTGEDDKIVSRAIYVEDYIVDEDGLVTDFGASVVDPDVAKGIIAEKITDGNVTLGTTQYVVADGVKIFVIDRAVGKITKGSTSSVKVEHNAVLALDEGEVVAIYVTKDVMN